MANHTEACHNFADILSATLHMKGVEFVDSEWLRVVMPVISPCWKCQDTIVNLQSTLSGRIYRQQMTKYVAAVVNDGPDVIDMFNQ